MTRAFMTLALCVAGASCGGPDQRSSAPAISERPAKVQPTPAVAPPCTSWATCELACPEGASLQRDETKRALFCALDDMGIGRHQAIFFNDNTGPQSTLHTLL